MRRVLLMVAMGILVLAGAAPADTLYLKNGAKFEGKLVREDESVIVFKIRGIGPQTFPRAKVLRVEKGASLFDEYEARRAKVKSGDAEGLFALGNWCYGKGLRQEGRRCYRAALKADPEHAGTRRVLGYVKVEGRWLDRRQLRRLRARQRKELERVLGGLKLGKPRRDEEAGVAFRIPEGWEKRTTEDGLGVEFLGPELLGVRLRIGYETASPLDLDDFRRTVADQLRKGIEGMKVLRSGEPSALGDGVARADVCTFRRGKGEVERADLYLERKEDVLHVWYECPLAHADGLRTFFGEVCRSFRPPRPGLGSRPFAYELPGTDWEKGFRLPEELGLDLSDFMTVDKDTEAIHHRTNPVVILMRREKNPTGVPLDLDAFRQGLEGALVRMVGAANLRMEPSRKREVAGRPAIIVPYQILAEGVALDGYACLFSTKSHVYSILVMSFFGQMGRKYLERDLGKLLDSFRI